VVGNSILDTRYEVYSLVSSYAVSIDRVFHSLLFANNQIGTVTCYPPIAAVAMGIQIYASSGVMNDINIRGNVFTDSGEWAIYTNPGGGGVRTRYIIENNTFLYTTDYDAVYGGTIFGWNAVALWNVTLAVVRNNTSWYPTAAGKDFGVFTNVGGCSVYTGDAVTAAETDAGAFSGTNLRLAY
jgi:hypothetical protein